VPQGFVRWALGQGISLRATTGKNPLQLGFVGATDDHDGVPGNTAEDTWPGHVARGDDTAVKRLAAAKPGINPGAITGVWAEENTREAIFAALERRETYATSGPRLAVRTYQTWKDEDFCTGDFPANVLAQGGVPMGGTMSTPPAGVTGPWLVINVAKDEHDIAEIDVIKGSYAGGKLTESVVKLAPNSPSAPCVRWHDESFDGTAQIYYYVRVLEAPSPRWSHYDCLKQPSLAACKPGGIDVDIQERAWTSPIWSAP
jgi:hypothetical protein